MKQNQHAASMLRKTEQSAANCQSNNYVPNLLPYMVIFMA